MMILNKSLNSKFIDISTALVSLYEKVVRIKRELMGYFICVGEVPLSIIA